MFASSDWYKRSTALLECEAETFVADDGSVVLLLKTKDGRLFRVKMWEGEARKVADALLKAKASK